MSAVLHDTPEAIAITDAAATELLIDGLKHQKQLLLEALTLLLARSELASCGMQWIEQHAARLAIATMKGERI